MCKQLLESSSVAKERPNEWFLSSKNGGKTSKNFFAIFENSVVFCFVFTLERLLIVFPQECRENKYINDSKIWTVGNAQYYKVQFLIKFPKLDLYLIFMEMNDWVLKSRFE